MSDKRSRPANHDVEQVMLAKKAKITFGRLNRRGKVIDHRIPIPILEGSMDESITDRDELMKLLTASSRQKLFENVMKNDAAREAISVELQLLFPKVVEDFAEAPKQTVVNATKHLRVDTDGFNTSDGEGFAYKHQENVGCDEYPEAIAPYLRIVHKIANIPTQNFAQEAMGLLLVIAQESTPEGQNQGGWGDTREMFDKAVDNMFVILAKKRKGLEGDGFDVKETLVALKGTTEALEVPHLSQCPPLKSPSRSSSPGFFEYRLYIPLANSLVEINGTFNNAISGKRSIAWSEGVFGVQC